MKGAVAVLGLGASIAQALSIPPAIRNGLDWLQGQQPIVQAEQFLIELAPGDRRLVTEDEKWELRRVCGGPLHRHGNTFKAKPAHDGVGHG